MGSGGISAHSGQVWVAVLKGGLQLNFQLLEWENYIEENICGENWKWDWFLDRELYIFYVCCCPGFYWLSIKISHCQIHYCILEEDLSFCYWLMLRELQMKFNCWWRTVYILCILLPRLWGLSIKISYHEIHYHQPGEYLSFLYARLKNGCIILWQYLRIRQSFPCFEIWIWNWVHTFSSWPDMSSLNFIAIEVLFLEFWQLFLCILEFLGFLRYQLETCYIH